MRIFDIVTATLQTIAANIPIDGEDAPVSQLHMVRSISPPSPLQSISAAIEARPYPAPRKKTRPAKKQQAEPPVQLDGSPSRSQPTARDESIHEAPVDRRKKKSKVKTADDTEGTRRSTREPKPTKRFEEGQEGSRGRGKGTATKRGRGR